MFRNIIVICFLITPGITWSQQDTVSFDGIAPQLGIEVISSGSPDQIKLRWAPKNEASYLSGLRMEYRIERFSLRNGSPVISSLKESIVSPWDSLEFLPYNDSDNAYVLMAGYAMYGEWESMNDESAGLFGKAQELTNRYSMTLLSADLDPLAAEALGWSYTDNDIAEGVNYLYRILPVDTLAGIHYGYITQAAIQPDYTDPFFTSAIELEGEIVLQWSTIYLNGDYSAYHVERSLDSFNFEKITKNPIVHAKTDDYASPIVSYVDSVINYQPYHYRLVGITPFGEKVIGTQIVKAQGRDKTPPQKAINVYIHTDPVYQTAEISWELPEDPEIEKVQLLRSYQFEGESDPISEPLDTDVAEFTDTIFDQLKFHYYQVATIDTAGNRSVTIPQMAVFKDSMPPAPPTGLTGAIDSNGIVTISWNRNTEPDLLGYSIYFANQGNHMFSNLSQRPQIDTFYVDTLQLNTTTEEIFYKIVAADYHYNVSNFGETIILKKPDIIPPLPPRFKAVKQKDGVVYLDMITSKAKDVCDQQLYRKSQSDTSFQLLGSIVQSVMVDSLILPSERYTYKATATDDDGLSASSEIVVKTRSSRPDAPSLMLHVDEVNSTVILEWSPDLNATEYMLYRSMDGGPFMNLKRIQDQASYIDASIKISSKYEYKLKVRWINGMASPFSEVKSAQVNPKSDSNE